MTYLSQGKTLLQQENLRKELATAKKYEMVSENIPRKISGPGKCMN